jgi:hypothetical protein
MNKWTVYLLVLLVSAVPRPTQAQTAVTNLTKVQVDLWPDLDRPALLVLITANLPADVDLPAPVRFRLPLEPSAVAYLAEDGQLLNAPFQIIAQDETTLIEVEAPAPTIRVEYYAPYNRTGNNVSLTYQWLGGVAADELTLMFREPSLATSVSPDPAFEDIGPLPDDGQRYFQRIVGAVGADETVSAAFDYVAPPPTFSNPSSNPTTTPAQQESSSTLPVVLAAAGGLLLGTGLGWALSNQRRTTRPAPRRAKPVQAGYCRACGARLKSGDAFCRQCGTRLR